MDKTSNIDSSYGHSISIAERKSIILTGVKKQKVLIMKNF